MAGCLRRQLAVYMHIRIRCEGWTVSKPGGYQHGGN